MVKAKLFSYKDSEIYYKRFKISPDRHFDRLCKIYGSDKAVEIIDENMQEAFEYKLKEDAKMEKELQYALENECPFREPL